MNRRFTFGLTDVGAGMDFILSFTTPLKRPLAEPGYIHTSDGDW
ncbi:MAG: hypothetical protein ACI9YM_000786 [Brevundimonas sp.]|jgi:hypothetical protein